MNRFNERRAETGGDRPHRRPPAPLDRRPAARGAARPPPSRRGCAGWTLELAGEPPYEVDPRDHDAGGRAAQARSDGLDLALISPSSPLGIELLPRREAEPLLDAYHDGALELAGRRSAPGRRACLTAPTPPASRRELGRGFVGLDAAGHRALDADGYARSAPLLDVLEDAGRPLFIHPGPAARGPASPDWWPTIVAYVQQMHAAWFAFRAFGRPRHPTPAGVLCDAGRTRAAPRRAVAGARRAAHPSSTRTSFLEVSSYGTRAIDATVRVLGIDVLVGGSDRRMRHRLLRPRIRRRGGDPRRCNATPSARLCKEVSMSWCSLPARNLGRAELEALVNELAPIPSGGAEISSFSGGAPLRVAVSRRPRRRVAAVLDAAATTRAGTTTTSPRARARGRRRADGVQPRIGGEAVPARCPAGESFSFGPDHIHRLPATASDRCRSMPTRRRSGAWASTRSRRRRDAPDVGSYADELRPLEEAWLAAAPPTQRSPPL